MKTFITVVLLAVLPVSVWASVDLVIPETWVAEGYPNNMSLYAQVLRADGTPIDHEQSVLAAFDAQGRCRGTISPSDGPNGKLFQMLIAGGDTPEPGLVLKVLDAVSGEIYLVQETVDFARDKCIPEEKGITNPLVLHVAGEDVSIMLEPGWNLVALAQPVTAETRGKLLEASPLRAEAGAYVQCTSVEEIQVGVGYWIFAATEKRIELVPDMSQTAEDVKLVKGWNLVGTSQEIPEWLPQAKCMFIWDGQRYRLANQPALGTWVYRE
jgi:hypothetical protein